MLQYRIRWTLQGAVVSLAYCYTSTEVQEVIQVRWRRWLLVRRVQQEYTRYITVQYSTVQYSTVHQEAGTRPHLTPLSHLIASDEELQQGVKFPTFQTLKTNLYLNQGEAGLDLNSS